jgi:shikimate dehydrogenase
MTGLVVLLGHRIGYSASPAMHDAAFAAIGLDARYELADVPPDGLADAVDRLRGSGRLGANVTQPHKLAACELVDELAPAVERLGAANTIVRDGPRLVAHNTDLPALDAELRALGSFMAATVLGSGGASRAAQAALADVGTAVRVVHRATWASLPGILAESDLLVNATPIGTASDDTPVGAGLLRPDLAVLDLVYRPSPTRLVREARALGATARGGAGMLLRQAAASFALWTGRDAPVAIMRDALRTELGPDTDA